MLCWFNQELVDFSLYSAAQALLHIDVTGQTHIHSDICGRASTLCMERAELSKSSIIKQRQQKTPTYNKLENREPLHQHEARR